MPVLSPATLSTLSVRIIACAAIVSVLVQLVKWKFPSVIQGRTVMYVNVAGSVSATLAFMDPAHFWTLATLQQIASIFLAAAGVHATVKGFAKSLTSSDPAPDFQPVQNVLGGSKGLMVLALLALACTIGCKTVKAATPATAVAPVAGAVDQTDAKANQSLQAMHAFLAQVSGDIQSGKLQLTPAQVALVNKANGAANVADAAEQAYHAGGGGNPSVLNAALSAVESAFAVVQSSLAAGVKH